MNQEELLEKYEAYLRQLAEENSSRIFTNGGIDFASVLMSILFKKTQKTIIMFCDAFKPELITREPYWNALRNYVKMKNKELKVLVHSDRCINDAPLQLLNETMNSEDEHASIQVRLITKEGEDCFKQLNFGKDFNFSVFDGKMFRFETDTVNYKAFGSFNMPDHCKELISHFNDAYMVATPLLG